VFVPGGYDQFFAMCDDGKYFNNTFNNNGKMVQYGDAPSDYMTSIIGNESVTWLSSVAKSSQPVWNPTHANVPFPPYIAPAGSNKFKIEYLQFFAYVGVHAPHVPATPAPWSWSTPLPSYQAPRTPNWNASGDNKHWLINQEPAFSTLEETVSDELYVRRLLALVSVDDLLQAIVTAIPADVLANTYIIYTSDHGYNLGQFRLPAEKFHHFENVSVATCMSAFLVLLLSFRVCILHIIIL
jgi:N-acetylglucosamine-6-sulfatase